MKVSIVIPCYNEKDTIERMVEAVRNAPLESREIIPVDDCSQDGMQTAEKTIAITDSSYFAARSTERRFAVTRRPTGVVTKDILQTTLFPVSAKRLPKSVRLPAKNLILGTEWQMC
jgi:glycosyltransferase involved in cell wall biosynthesis